MAEGREGGRTHTLVWLKVVPPGKEKKKEEQRESNSNVKINHALGSVLTVVDGMESRTLCITSCNMSAFAACSADADRRVVVRASAAQLATMAAGASSVTIPPGPIFTSTGTDSGGSKSSCALAATAAAPTALPCSGSAW